MEIKDNPTTYEYKLEKIVPNQYKNNEEEFFKDIKEICFTVFKEDMCMQNVIIKIHKIEVDLESK